MTYMLNDIDEAIDRKFLVTKTLSNQVQAGTIVHIMDAHSEKDGKVTVYYRITYTKQDYTVKFDNVKQFCKWARPDNFIARHYEGDSAICQAEGQNLYVFLSAADSGRPSDRLGGSFAAVRRETDRHYSGRCDVHSRSGAHHHHIPFQPAEGAGQAVQQGQCKFQLAREL